MIENNKTNRSEVDNMASYKDTSALIEAIKIIVDLAPDKEQIKSALDRIQSTLEQDPK